MLDIRLGHVLDTLRAMPSDSIHCVVTSPPYWGLRDYKLPPSSWGDGWQGCLGLEPDPRMFIAHIVEVFEEVRRVLRPDGTLWLNLGDSYATGAGKANNPGSRVRPQSGKHLSIGDYPSCQPNRMPIEGIRPKSLLGLPWRCALALSDAGWTLRSEIIWHKRSAMPESVYDRPTRAHEHVFLLSKSTRYFFDHIGASEPAVGGHGGNGKRRPKEGDPGEVRSNPSFHEAMKEEITTRNMRTVWSLSTEKMTEAHFAAFPTKLVEKCLRAGISLKGVCSLCGAPIKRQFKKTRVPTRPGIDNKRADPRPSQHDDSPFNVQTIAGNNDPERHVTAYETIGWKRTCECEAREPAPPKVLDPFLGSGTTAIVAHQFGADCIGCELNPSYAAIAERRMQGAFGMFAKIGSR